MNDRWYAAGPFTVFDVETTGMSPVGDRIVELAALRVETDGSRRRFEQLINPGRRIPSAVSAIHHITDAMVADAPDFAQIGSDFLDFAADSVLVAHNARFDLGFLQESLHRAGLPLWQGKTLDSLRLVRRTHPGLPSYRLQYLRRYFQLDDAPGMCAHRAGSDVEWTCQLLEIVLSGLLRRDR